MQLDSAESCGGSEAPSPRGPFQRYRGVMTVTSVLELTIKPESLNDAERILEETLATTRSFAGNLGCKVAVDTSDPAHFVVFEHWTSLEADDAYRAFRATPQGASGLGSIIEGLVLTRYTDL